MTCTPPPGTAPGTLCVLQHPTHPPILAIWHQALPIDTGRWRFGSPSHGQDQISPDRLADAGWRYAGPAPELPRVPRTPQEIAREQLGRSYPSDAACISALKIALERIRDMPESP